MTRFFLVRRPTDGIAGSHGTVTSDRPTLLL